MTPEQIIRALVEAEGEARTLELQLALANRKVGQYLLLFENIGVTNERDLTQLEKDTARGNKIAAIKMMRERFGHEEGPNGTQCRLPLRDAKDLVEGYLNSLTQAEAKLAGMCNEHRRNSCRDCNPTPGKTRGCKCPNSFSRPDGTCIDCGKVWEY